MFTILSLVISLVKKILFGFATSKENGTESGNEFLELASVYSQEMSSCMGTSIYQPHRGWTWISCTERMFVKRGRASEEIGERRLRIDPPPSTPRG